MICPAALQQGFSAVAHLWNGWVERQESSSVFLTPQWQETWWDQFGTDGRELVLLLIGGEADPLGLAPMMREGDTLSFLGSTDLFDYHDFILGASDPALFYPSLVSCLSNESWRLLQLESIQEGSPTLHYLPDLFREAGYSVTVQQEDVTPGLPLPASWDEYQMALRKKDRHELRRKLRRLDASGEYRLVHASPETLEQDLSLFLDLMQESKGEKRDFLVPDRQAFFQVIMDRMYQEGLARLIFLEVGGERVAAVICFDHAGRRFLYNSGFRLSHSHYSVGILLKALCIEDAIREGLVYFDFLRGPEPYKYDLGGKDVNLYRIDVTR